MLAEHILQLRGCSRGRYSAASGYTQPRASELAVTARASGPNPNPNPNPNPSPNLGSVELVVTEVIRVAAGEGGEVRDEVLRHQPLDSARWRRLLRVRSRATARLRLFRVRARSRVRVRARFQG